MFNNTMTDLLVVGSVIIIILIYIILEIGRAYRDAVDTINSKNIEILDSRLTHMQNKIETVLSDMKQDMNGLREQVNELQKKLSELDKEA